MKLRTIALGGIALSTLVGCTGPLDELRQVHPGTGTAFTRALADGYLAFADVEADQYDWIDSRHFAQKGLAASRGEVVAPEQPQDWRIAKVPAPELAAARARLTTALDAGGRDRQPEAAAKAQVGYDCWLEQLEEGWQDADIEACRSQFETALAQIEGAKPATQAPAPSPAPALAEASDRYQVYFDFASAQLTPIALNIVEEAARAGSKAKVLVLGYADRSGPTEANLALSARRADAVKQALVRFGIAADRIGTLGLGETEPLVPTPDGVREPHNRRAVIRFE